MSPVGKGFVKSASTSTPVRNSEAELKKLLLRYGCKAYAISSNYETGEAVVKFVVPDSQANDAVDIPVMFKVVPKVVYDAMYGRPMKYDWNADDGNGGKGKHVHNPNGYNPRALEQAERVAWRQLILWIDAALSVAASGMAGVAETFLAHTLVRGDDGQVKPMIQHLNEHGEGFMKLLAPGGNQ